MPAISARQYGLMQRVLHGQGRKGDPSPEVAARFIEETPHAQRSKFAKQLANKQKRRKQKFARALKASRKR